MANKKTAAPVKTAGVLPFDKPVMILYVICCIRILSAMVFSILTAVPAGDASGCSAGGDLILLTAAFVSVFFTLLMLNEGKQKAAAAVSVPQILASPGIAYAMFPLCGVMYYVMCLYSIRKAGNVSFLREQPGYGH